MLSGFLAAACGGGSNQAATPPASSPSPAASLSASALPSASADGLARAQALVAKYSAPATQVAPLQQVLSKPPTGKTIACLQNSAGGQVYVDICNAMKAAAKILGWTVKTLDENGSVKGVGDAFTQALQLHVDGIEDSDGQRVESYPTQFAQAKKQAVPVVWTSIPLPGQTPENDGQPTFPIIGGQGQAYGQNLQTDLLGAIIATQSDCQVHLAFQTAHSLAVIKGYDEKVQSKVSNFCPNAKFTTIENPITDMGTPAANARAVSELQSTPDVNFVFSAIAPWLSGLPAAIHGAGLPARKFVSANPQETDLAALKNGTYTSLLGTQSAWFGWYAMDSFVRYFTHSPLVTEQESTNPMLVLNKATVVAIEAGGSGIEWRNGISTDSMISQFKQSWKVG
jgi:ABC-type sugar transport system substrate-binding protein